MWGGMMLVDVPEPRGESTAREERIETHAFGFAGSSADTGRWGEEGSLSADCQ